MTDRGSTRALLYLGVAAFLLALVSVPAHSWLSQYTGANNVDHWDFTAFPVTWNINTAIGSNVKGSRSVHTVIAASFASWQTAPNTTLAIAEGPQSGIRAEANSPGNINLICFVCTDADFSKDSSTLAVTITTTADRAGEDNGHGGTSRFAGQIIKSDILFNPNVTFTTGGTDGQDLQTVATHEIGHFFGLDHSAVVRAVMFPFASDLITLSYDDVAAISTVYPKTNSDYVPSSIAGKIQFASGGGVLGAHVFAESTTADLPIGGNIRKSPVGTLSFPDGSYRIQGLPPDKYNVTAEPLDSPVQNSDVSGFAQAFGKGSVQTNFTTRWH
jgi:matrixin